MNKAKQKIKEGHSGAYNIMHLLCHLMLSTKWRWSSYIRYKNIKSSACVYLSPMLSHLKILIFNINHVWLMI